MKLLLEDMTKYDGRVCSRVPAYVDKNVEFLVDTSQLLHWRDVMSDLSGFTRTKTKKMFYKSTIGVLSKDSSEYDIAVTRFILTHSTHKDFHKVIISLTQKDRTEPEALFYVQYYFDGPEHDIDFSKTIKKEETTFSTRKKIKELSSNGIKGKKIFQQLAASSDFDSARTVLDTPPSLAKIYDISRKNPEKVKQSDDILELVEMCNLQKDRSDAFLRDVRISPEFSAVLTNDRQLNDIHRFCVKTNSSVFGVDPTFNICSHNVTVTTYKHPLLLVKETGVHPVFIGPVLIHSSKTFESYFTLPSTMIRLRPGLSDLKTFGTDDEANVYKAMGTCFLKSNHLLCFIHGKDNISEKLSQLGAEDVDKYVEEIFGVKVGDTKVKGLVDCESEEKFERRWEELVRVWKTRTNGNATIKYLLTYKKEKIKRHMLLPIRQKSGLGYEEYDQNCNECINSVLKKSKGAGIITIKDTVDLISSEVKIQEDRIKSALLDRGDWKLAPEVEKLKINSIEYYRMKPEERTK